MNKRVAGRRRARILHVGGGLVALQMAVSIILLTGSSLFFHSLIVAKDTDSGSRPRAAVSL